MMCFLSADECGIVAQISEPLATADIPAYYISTFKFDHALVRPVDSPDIIIKSLTFDEVTLCCRTFKLDA